VSPYSVQNVYAFGSKLQIFDKGENLLVLLRNTICADQVGLAQTKRLCGDSLIKVFAELFSKSDHL